MTGLFAAWRIVRWFRPGALRVLAWVLALGLVASGPGLAQTPRAPEVTAKAFLLVDLASGQTLAERDADVPFEPGSLVKLMTAYLVFDALRTGELSLDGSLTMDEAAWGTAGARMFLPAPGPVRVEDLIKGMLVLSANDAALTLAAGVAGDVPRFIERMNRQAQVLGLRGTRYTDPTGLSDPLQRSTARDVAVLAAHLIRDFPEQAPYFALQRYRHPQVQAGNDANRNLLVFRDPSVDGLQGGYAPTSGYSLVASARRPAAALGEGPAGLRRMLAIVWGSSGEEARAVASQKLLNWGYSAFAAVRLFAPGQPVAQAPVWKGGANTVALGRPEGIVVSVPADEIRGLRTELLRPEPLVAPLLQGQPLGTLSVQSSAGRTVADIPLQVLHTVPEAGVLGRAWDALRLWIR